MPRATWPESCFSVGVLNHAIALSSNILSKMLATRNHPLHVGSPAPGPGTAARRREDCQANRDRNAIYAYLTGVYGLVAWWTAEGREIDRARRALRLQRLKVSDREDPFAAIIRCTADSAKAGKRTRSKWSRLMRYAAVYKRDSDPLDQFVRRKGGINACAARFSRCLGRGQKRSVAVAEVRHCGR
jgi:hypothetical protein